MLKISINEYKHLYQYLPVALVDVDILVFNGIFDVKCLDDSLPVLSWIYTDININMK